MPYIVALDQGTTSCRAILFDTKSNLIGIAQKEFAQHFPKPGWVEHDADEIWNTQMEVFRELLSSHSLNAKDIMAIGITNQRETTVAWHRKKGHPLCKAIVWQDKRTSDFCQRLKADGHEGLIREKTGLVVDAYFSATKIHWMLANVSDARRLADQGDLCVGTIDSWLLWKLTNTEIHATDYTNASRTMLYNIHGREWDTELLHLFGIPDSVLPEVYPSSHHFGDFIYEGHPIPIMGIAGDQQSALFGQGCYSAGEAKNTYGTGCFMLLNTGAEAKTSQHGLITTMACSLNDEPMYALEGSIFIAGAAVQWLRDGLKILDSASDSAYFAEKAITDEVFLVPAFAGMGAPYWDQYARGAIFGLTRDTGKSHIIKATLQSIAYQVRDVKAAMEQDAGLALDRLMVDGGAVANDYLMQFQADMLNLAVDRPAIIESTALGAAHLAGLKAGAWDLDYLKKVRQTEMTFQPKMEESRRENLYSQWKKAVTRTLNWLDE